MLQQTQVATVIPYYHKFLSRFPDPHALASADEDEIFRYWAGLGYYRRARQLHAAAKKIVDEYAGAFPNQRDDVLALPGIGKYTAHAILSFAFDQRLGIVEANTQRLYARLLHLDKPTQSAESQHQLWDFANNLVPAKNCGEFNQAMMEIGSQLCTPKNPQCHICPLLTSCPTGQLGHTDQIPVPKPSKTITDLTEAVVLVKNTSAQYLVRRCDHGERWAGLWDFPRFDVTGYRGTAELKRKLQKSLSDRFCLRADVADTQRSLRHTVTRYRIHLLCFYADVREEQIQKIPSPPHPDKLRWLRVDALQELAWNASAKRILKWVQESHRPENLGSEGLGSESL